jgi:hypothetical protein
MPVLVVQMGHAYRKSGSTGTTGEQAYATSVANACVNLLHGRGGWTVRRILADDSLSRYAGDAFVAVHCDGSTSSSARGASIGYRNAAGQRFGQAWKRFYLLRGWTGGFRPDNYTPALAGYYGTGNALSQGNTRAFIAECGFMTNAQDRALLTAAGGPTRVALAIGDALGINTKGDDDVTPDDIEKVAQRAAKLVLTYKNPEVVGANGPDVYELLTDSWKNSTEAEFGSDVDIENQKRIGYTRADIAALVAKVDDLLARLPEGN